MGLREHYALGQATDVCWPTAASLSKQLILQGELGHRTTCEFGPACGAYCCQVWVHLYLVSNLTIKFIRMRVLSRGETMEEID